MTKQLQMIFFAGIGVLASVLNSSATVYYVNDTSTNYDVYCSTTGNSANDGLTPATPKASLADVVSIWDKDDVVYIDTGEYKQSVQIKSTGGGRVTLVGSTNGTCLVGKFRLDGASVSVDISNLVFYAESDSAFVNYHALMTLSNVRIISTNGYALEHFNARAGSSFQNCVLYGRQALWDRYALPGNNAFAFTNCTIVSKIMDTGQLAMTTIYDHCMLVSLEGPVFSSVQASKVSGCNNLFFGPQGIGASAIGFEDFKRIFTNFTDSVWGNPEFVDVDNLDFHLSSPSGHFVEYSTGYGVITGREWVVDSSLGYSAAIDAGDSQVGVEPSPNGGRRNLGAYGGTKWASKSRSADQKWLQVQSCNDGGVVTGQADLRWNAGNFASGEKVQVQLSTNAGAQWVTLKTVAAATQSYAWTVTAAQASPQCLWRVLATNDASVVSTTERIFSARPSTSMSFKFYVNDDSLTDDRFCTVTGNDDNDGLSPATPKRTIQSVLDTYALYAGDEIRVDAGTYDEESPVAFGIYDSGVSGAPVVLRGAGSSTILARGNQTWDVVQANSAQWLTLKDMVLNGGRYGFFANSSANLSLENVEVVGNQVGIYIQGALATNISMDHLSIHGNNYGINAAAAQNVAWVSNSVIWNNATALTGKSPLLEVSHSIIGGDAACTLLGSTTFPAGDYNVLQVSKFSSAIA